MGAILLIGTIIDRQTLEGARGGLSGVWGVGCRVKRYTGAAGATPGPAGTRSRGGPQHVKGLLTVRRI